MPSPPTNNADDDRVGVFSILVVCTANICRSPTAEHLLRDALARPTGSLARPTGALERPSGALERPTDALATTEGAQPAVGFEVGSAGVRGWDGSPMDPTAAAELRRLGGDPSGFTARSFTAEMAHSAGLVLTATTDHRAYVLHEVPRALHRTFTLLEFAYLVSEIDRVREAQGDPTEVVRRAARHRGAAQPRLYDVADPYGLMVEAYRETAELLDVACRTVAAILCERTAGT